MQFSNSANEYSMKPKPQQGQQAHQASTGQPGRQRAHAYDRVREPERRRRRGDPVDVALRRPGALHQEQADRERGPQGRPAQAVPARATAAAQAPRVEQRKPGPGRPR